MDGTGCRRWEKNAYLSDFLRKVWRRERHPARAYKAKRGKFGRSTSGQKSIRIWGLDTGYRRIGRK